jgi:hypothetical protein
MLSYAAEHPCLQAGRVLPHRSAGHVHLAIVMALFNGQHDFAGGRHFLRSY